MNFVKAFSETIGKEAAAPEAPAAPTATTAPDNFTSDDMKSYVDAKFEALKSDLLHEMQSLRQVETPQETDKGSNNSEENKKEELNNASSTDLSDN